MNKITSEIVLRTGAKIPAIGFGTYQITGESCFDSVATALSSGYTHIDTASFYKNEEPLSRAIKQSKFARQDLFITSKLGPTEMGFEKAKEACYGILKRLGMEYLDLLLIHWPAEGGKSPSDKGHPMARVETWKAMQELQKQGKVRDIGVSNFLVHHLEHLIKETGVTPSVNQFQLHPFLYNKALIEYCRQHNIAIEAYSPLARNESSLINDPIVIQLSKKYNKTPHQILIRWSVQNGFIVLPKSKTKERIQDNYKVFDFELSAEEMNKMNEMDRGFHTCWNPDSVTY